MKISIPPLKTREGDKKGDEKRERVREGNESDWREAQFKNCKKGDECCFVNE